MISCKKNKTNKKKKNQSDIKIYFTRHIKCETGEPHRKADPGSRDLICANGGVNIVE